MSTKTLKNKKQRRSAIPKVENISTHLKKDQGKDINTNSSKHAVVVTLIFFCIALIGLYYHEMWRDEHQAWMVARDADSISDLFQNLKYEGNPGLWHLLLFILTKFTSNPVFMQALHLLIACSFIYVFNKFAPFSQVYKVLFTFGYLPLYEYTVISRSYGLAMLLFFICLALYKSRQSKYILIGSCLALLANVTSFSLVIASCLAAVLIIDFYKKDKANKKYLVQFGTGMFIFVFGALLSAYQIYPEEDNSFPAQYPDKLVDLTRMGYTFSNLFTTYFYLPGSVDIHFWNTNIYLPSKPPIDHSSFSDWITSNKEFLWLWWILPSITLIALVISLLKKPIALLFYVLGTFGLLALFYYTGMAYSRYTGHLIVVLIGAYWMKSYYPDEKIYKNQIIEKLSLAGKAVGNILLAVILLINMISALIAYLIDINYKFTPSKDVAEYLKESRLDQYPLIGFDDFIASPVSSYLNKPLHYPEMNKKGSFVIWSDERKIFNFDSLCNSIQQFMSSHSKAILIKSTIPQLHSGNVTIPMERAIIKSNIKLEMIQSFEQGIVKDEQYYIYSVEKVDPKTIDKIQYPVLN